MYVVFSFVASECRTIYSFLVFGLAQIAKLVLRRVWWHTYTLKLLHSRTLWAVWAMCIMICYRYFIGIEQKAQRAREREKKSINATRDQFWRMVCVCVSFASLVRPRFGPTLAKHRQTYTVTAPAFAFLFFSFGKIPSLLAFNTQPGRAGWVAFRANQQNGKKSRKQKYWKPQFDFYL